MACCSLNKGKRKFLRARYSYSDKEDGNVNFQGRGEDDKECSLQKLDEMRDFIFTALRVSVTVHNLGPGWVELLSM